MPSSATALAIRVASAVAARGTGLQRVIEVSLLTLSLMFPCLKTNQVPFALILRYLRTGSASRIEGPAPLDAGLRYLSPNGVLCRAFGKPQWVGQFSYHAPSNCAKVWRNQTLPGSAWKRSCQCCFTANGGRVTGGSKTRT